MFNRTRQWVRAHKMLAATALGIGVFLMTSADTCNSNSTGGTQSQGNKISSQYQSKANQAVPYPLSQMGTGGWLERRLLVENLLRQNDPHRTAYVALLNQLGNPIAYYTIQGMVFELNSQLTPTQSLVDSNGNAVTDSNSCNTCSVVDSPGDNGTYGPEPHGIGFFTAEGVEVKWNGEYIEQDSPFTLTTKPVIVYDPSTAKPTVSHGGVAATNGVGH